MKTKHLLLALLGLSTLISPLSTLGQGTAFTYQGFLTDQGAPANGNYDLRFAVVNDDNGGVPLGGWLTNSATGVTNGLFTVTLDFGNQFPGSPRWLEIAVRTNGGGAFATLVPRQRLAATPYAVTAGTISGALPAGQITGAVTLAQLPASVVTNGASGVNISGTFTGNGAGVTNLNLALNSGGDITLSGGFVLSSSPTVGLNPRGLTAADVNGDGKPDLISANFNGDTLTVLTNNGSGGFVLSSSLSVDPYPNSVTSADVNGDGKPDLISANNGIFGTSTTLTVFTNNGSGGFVLASKPAVLGPFPVAVTSADVNGDGKPDLINANYGSGLGNTLTVLTNNGTGGFAIASSPTVGSQPQSVAAADVNGDGKPDLISANTAANTLTVLTNNGSGGFVITGSPGVGAAPVSVTAADVNGDGKPDLISANANANTLTVLTNNGSGGFVLSSSPSVGINPVSVTAADVNGDGKPDLMSANANANTLTVLTNNGSGGFVLALSPGVGRSPYSVISADVNVDGRPDLISANSGAGNLSVLISAATFFGTFDGGFNGSFKGNGSGLTSVPTNVALLNFSQTFTAPNNFNSDVMLNPPASLSLGSQTRQMINLWSTEYGLGVQGNAAYFRSSFDFFWYRGGSHSDGNGDAGGGVPLMTLHRSGNLGLGTTTPGYPLEVQNGFAVGRFTTTNSGNGAVLILKNTATPTVFLGAINFDDATGTPGQIGYLASGQMTFRVAGADRMNLQAGGLFVNGAIVLTSDRNAKEDIAAVDAQAVLEKVAALPLQSWSYTNRPGVKHVGPMAQDFRAAFGLGEDDKHIATVDADGVALAAIQGLNEKVEVRSHSAEVRIRELEETVAELTAVVTALNQKLNGGGQ